MGLGDRCQLGPGQIRFDQGDVSTDFRRFSGEQIPIVFFSQNVGTRACWTLAKAYADLVATRMPLCRKAPV